LELGEFISPGQRHFNCPSQIGFRRYKDPAFGRRGREGEEISADLIPGFPDSGNPIILDRTGALMAVMITQRL